MGFGMARNTNVQRPISTHRDQLSPMDLLALRTVIFGDYAEGGLAVAKTVRVRISTNVRRIGNGTYQVRTTTSKGGSTKTTTRTVRAR